MKVIVIGARGFVGSAFVRYLARTSVDVVQVTRDNYTQLSGTMADIVVEASCNSRKFLAEEQPLTDFRLSVTRRLQTLRDFPGGVQVHISSVDVYSNLASVETTREDSVINIQQTSNYGCHKLMAELLVRHYAPRWLIVRLAGMVGPGLRKNPVYDILHSQPLRIHPDSMYQFMLTDDGARVVWSLIEAGRCNEVFNVCGDGLISPREIALTAKKTLDLALLDPRAAARVLNVNIAKCSSVVTCPRTYDTIVNFIQGSCV